MSARKSGNHIYVEGTGNTMASVTADIADSTFIEEISPDVYEVKGDVARYFYVRPNAFLDIQDGETLQFNPLANDRNRLYVYYGGTLRMRGASALDFTVSAFRSSAAYIYGSLDWQGDGVSNPLINNPYRIYMYEQQNNNSYPNDIWHVEHVTLGGVYAQDYYFFYFNGQGKTRQHIFRNILCDDTLGRAGAKKARHFYFSYPMIASDKMIFENINFQSTRYGMLNYGVDVVAKGNTWNDCYSWSLYHYKNGFFDPSYKANDGNSQVNAKARQQLGSFYDGCTFTGVGSDNGLIASRGALVLFRDCAWQAAGGDIMQVEYGSVVRMWTGNTQADTTPYWDLQANGCIQHVHALDLTVQDADGSPIEGAIVVVTQSEGKELFTLQTGPDGKVVNSCRLNVIILTHQHQYENNPSTNVEYWSDASNGTFHTVDVLVPGYNHGQATAVMDAEKSMTITLTRKLAHAAGF